MSRSTSAERQRRRRMVRGRAGALLTAMGSAAFVIAGFAAPPAAATTSCDPASDACAIEPDILRTPVGIVTVTVSENEVVTVQLEPSSPGSLMFGIPFAIPPGPPCKSTGSVCGLPGYARTSIDTAAGLVVIDTVLFPVSRFSLPNIAIVSIHPPSPCKASTNGMTVGFRPLPLLVPRPDVHTGLRPHPSATCVTVDPVERRHREESTPRTNRVGIRRHRCGPVDRRVQQ